MVTIQHCFRLAPPRDRPTSQSADHFANIIFSLGTNPRGKVRARTADDHIAVLSVISAYERPN